MNRKGFMYSVFAIFLIGLLAVIVADPVRVADISKRTEVSRVDATYYFLTSATSDIERGTRIVAKRAVSAAANVVASDLAPLDDGEAAVVSGFRNGTVNGSVQPLLDGSTIRDWREGMVEQAAASGWDLNLSFPGVATSAAAPARVWMNLTVDVVLRDPASDSRFRRTVRHNRTVAITNITDPLLLLETNGRYSRGFERCRAEDRAVQHATGTERYYSAGNWTSGEPVKRPGNGDLSGVASPGEKVAIVADICAYPDSAIADTLSDFGGVVSEAAGGIAADGSTVCGDADSSGFDNYVGGASGALDVANTSIAVMVGEQVWQNNMVREVERGCYFRDTTGPTVYGRMEGRLIVQPRYATGWGSFLFLPDLPADFQDTSRSAVDHVYFNDTFYGANHDIRGVTDHYPWFHLDQDHVDRWGLEPLSYN